MTHNTYGECLIEEKGLMLKHLSNADCFRLAQIALEFCRKNYSDGVAVEIERNGQVVFFFAMEGATDNNALWIRRKKNIVRMYQHSSRAIGLLFEEKGTTVNEGNFLSPFDYQAHGGCHPILLSDTGMIGTIAVSGLPALEDHRVCVSALCQLQAEQN